jgi:opacity protein-like surface antigen
MKFILSSLAIASLSVTSTQVFAQEKIITSSPKPQDAKGFYGTLGLGYAAYQDIGLAGSILGQLCKNGINIHI